MMYFFYRQTQREIEIGIIIVGAVLLGMVLTTTPTLVMGYFSVNATKPSPYFSPSMQRQVFQGFLGAVYIGHDNATNEDHYYIPRDSPFGTSYGKYLKKLETYAITAVPAE